MSKETRLEMTKEMLEERDQLWEEFREKRKADIISRDVSILLDEETKN